MRDENIHRSFNKLPQNALFLCGMSPRCADTINLLNNLYGKQEILLCIFYSAERLGSPIKGVIDFYSADLILSQFGFRFIRLSALMVDFDN